MQMIRLSTPRCRSRKTRFLRRVSSEELRLMMSTTRGGPECERIPTGGINAVMDGTWLYNRVEILFPVDYRKGNPCINGAGAGAHPRDLARHRPLGGSCESFVVCVVGRSYRNRK